jgi:ABC-type uncharacterized transport system auxiliary subunit
MPANRTLNCLLGSLFVLTLGACSGFLDSGKPARQVYLLSPPNASAATVENDNKPALILSVSAVPGLDTDRILVLGNDAQLNPVANAHWSDHIPEVFTSITRRYLSKSGRFSFVREGNIARPNQWQMNLEVQAFYGTQNGSGNTDSALLEMEALIVCADKHQVLRLKQEMGARGDSLSSIVSAHQEAINAALSELLSKTMAACSEN